MSDTNGSHLDQARNVNAALARLGVLEPGDLPPDPPAPEGVSPAGEHLPGLELPRDGWGLDDFAREAGKVTRTNGVFRRDFVPVTVNRETGQVEPLPPDTFRTYLAELAFLYKWKSQGKDLPPKKVKVTMSTDTAKGCLASPQFLNQQRKLTRVNAVRQPIMRASGRIELLPEGYDDESGIYTMPSEVEIRENMSIDEAREILLDLHREFPFGDWSHLPVEERRESRELAKQVCAMVSFYGSLLLPHTIKRQGFLYNANTHRSGKTLLAQMVVIPVQGRCKLRSKPDSPEEFRKVLDTVALAASPYLVLDDLSGRLSNQDLNAFMTSPWWSGRAMHSQREFEVATHTNIFLTGHNLDTTGDISGRVMEVSLHVEEADVQNHSVKRVINEHWLTQTETRSEICSALYTLVKHWEASGRPEGPSVKAGYDAWCRLFGGICIAAGFGDPMERRATDETTDPEFENMRLLVSHFGEQMKGETKVAEVRYDELIAACQELNLFEWIIEGKWNRSGGEPIFEPSSRCNSRLGLLWSRKYGGRLFHCTDGRTVRFGSRGKMRHKKYTLTIEGEAPAVE